MKNIFKVIAAGLFLVSACEEVVPTGLNLLPEKSIFDTTFITNAIPAPQLTNVLIEDFTGVKCVNCPRAQATAKTIKEANVGRVYIMAIHPGRGLLTDFVRPFKEPGDDYTSNYDFRTDEGADIITLLGSTGQLPTGAINRTLFSGETKVLLDDPKWSSKTSEKLPTSSIVNIDTFSNKGVYFLDGNKIRVNVKLTYTSSTNDSQFITIAIIEDKLIDRQENPGGTVTVDYEHNHILRRTITPALGSQLKASIIPGRVFEKTYEYEIDPATDINWHKENLKLLVLVHNGTLGTNKYVIQQVKEYEIH